MKPNDDSSDDGLSPTERSAAEWVLRLAQGLTPEEEKDLARWLAEDPRHPRILDEMERTSRLLDGLKFRIPHEAGAQAGESQPAEHRHFGWLKVAVGIAATVVFMVGIWQVNQLWRLNYSATENTQVGQSRRLLLPDGSVIVMNTDTHVRIAYGRRERLVYLTGGEAYFTVAKNPARPFVVQAGGMAVRAVGTAFDVRLRTDALNVLVTEGKVWVSNDDAKSSGATEPVLGVGHLASVPLRRGTVPDAQALTVTAVEPRAMHNALAWQAGRLEFFDTPLSEVVSEFNRYNDRRIVIADPGLASLRFGGSFGYHGIEPFLELLEQNFNVTAEQHGNEIMLRQAK